MNSMRKFLCVLTAVVLVAFALPVVAAIKSFDITVAPISLPTQVATGAGTTTTIPQVGFKFANTSPGNSVIKSVIITAPQGVSLDTPSSVNVSYQGGAPVATATTPCPTSTANGSLPLGSSICVANLMGIKAGGGFATVFVDAQIANTAACNASAVWQGQAFTGNQTSSPWGGQPFAAADAIGTLEGTDGIDKAPADVGCESSPIACMNTFNKVNGFTSVTLGQYNTDGTVCTSLVTFGVSDTTHSTDVNDHNKMNVHWDGDNNVFVYTVTWDKVIATQGWQSALPFFAWELNSSNLPAYARGQSCTSGVPQAFATVQGPIAADLPSIPVTLVTGATIPKTPFTARIEAEQVIVTNVSASLLQVIRGTANTTAAPHTDVPVANDPMPIISQAFVDTTFYQPGTAAEMCVLSQNASTAGHDAFGNLLIQYITTIVDTASGGWGTQ
jgi:hypothetical protein